MRTPCLFACLLLSVAPLSPQELMTNDSVVKMVKAGVTEDIIISAVQRYPGKYAVSPDELISLKAAGVPDKVVAAMLDKSPGAPAPPPATAAVSTRGALESGAYRIIQVARFEKDRGVDMPPEAVAALSGDIVSELWETHKFEKVLAQGEQPEAAQRYLKVVGTVVEFKKGSRMTRYMLGPAALAGPGKSVVKARVKVIDGLTGEVLHEQHVDGRVWIGFFGGSSDGAKEGLAKEVAKVVTKKFF